MSDTKLCKHCRQEMPKKAKVCPTCRRKQGGALGLVLIIIGFLIFILGFCSSLGGEADSEDATTNTTITTEETKPDDSEDVENKITVGSIFEASDLYITIDDADLEFTDYDDAYSLYEPHEGMKFIMVSFTYDNQSKSDKYASIYDFNCYADGTACEQVYLPDESDFINTNLSTNRNVSFRTYYEVPVNAEKIELEYETNIWTGNKVLIELN